MRITKSSEEKAERCSCQPEAEKIKCRFAECFQNDKKNSYDEASTWFHLFLPLLLFNFRNRSPHSDAKENLKNNNHRLAKHVSDADNQK